MSTLDEAEMVEASLEEVPTTISPIAKTPEPISGTPPADASHLQEKANKALEELLATKSFINAHRQKVVWELGMELHQNDSETTESIKEARAIHVCATPGCRGPLLCNCQGSQGHLHPHCLGSQSPLLCSHQGCRDLGASQADSLQWRHVKTIQHLEEQVIQEEGKSQIDFLSACQAALQASPVELRGMLVASYHLLIGQAPTSHPFTLSQGASPIEQPSTPAAPSSPVPEHSPRAKQ